jgi:hypothetical protein
MDMIELHYDILTSPLFGDSLSTFECKTSNHD